MGRGAVTGLAVAAALSGAAVALAAPPNGPPDRDGGTTRTFDVTGTVDGLLPTVQRDLPVLLESPYRFDVDVVTIDVDVGDPPGDCDAVDLLVSPPQVPVTVPARSEVTLVGSAALAADAPDACQGAVWPLTWTATATRA